MFHLNRTERDIVATVHRWARRNGWTYDATTLDNCVTDYRWLSPDYTVIVRVDHAWPTPWTVEVDGPPLSTLTAECTSVSQTVAVLAAFGALPPTFSQPVDPARVLADANDPHVQDAGRVELAKRTGHADPASFPPGAKRAAAQMLARPPADLVDRAPAEHVIEIEDAEDDRSYWQCDCGRSGSCASYNVDINAEKHVSDGESVAYRHSGGDPR